MSMRAAPSRQKAAPTIASLAEEAIGVCMKAVLSSLQPLETKRRREAACGSTGRGAPLRD
jgi:hypothetical protein